MNIYTLGTGHGDSSISRFNSSTVYETEDGSLYLVDAGAPVEALLRRKGLRISDLRNTFITHMHDDHVGGLTGLLKQVVKYPEDRKYPLSLYMPEERSISALKNWMRALHEEPTAGNAILYYTVKDGEIYSDENLTVTAIRTRHLCTEGRTKGTPCSFAYMLDFKNKKRRVLHTGDLASDFSDFPGISFEEHFDLCLCEATHYDPEIASSILKRADFDRLLFTHIGDRWHIRVSDQWQVYNGEKALLSYCKALPYPVKIAHDGDELEL